MANNQEIMANEEVMEVAEQIVADDSGKAGVIVAAIGAVVVGGFITYKVITKIAAKVKAKKEKKARDEEYPLYDPECDEDVVVVEDYEETK